MLRVGRYGPYLERDGERANVPDDLVPDELTVEKAEELLAQPSQDRALGVNPETGREVVARNGRYGPYVTETLPEGSKEKPPTASLFKTMSLDTITLEDALQLLQLPRVVGVGEDGEEIVVAERPLRPVRAAGQGIALARDGGAALTIGLEDAKAILAKPKERRGRQPAPPLKEVGADPVSGKPIVVKAGRFGPYVTDGETNASLRTGDDPEADHLDRAVELLAERRARGRRSALAARGSRRKGVLRSQLSQARRAS